ncbi:MAG: ABC transporter substrate-binding protein [Defluviitaleaceae bacterium]|nr:ABC transporter substrate-binding protein [Defluviitaleaceae bacterium]
MSLKKCIVLFLTLSMFAVMAACGESAPAGGGSGGEGSPLRIGAITSLSGALQSYGEDFQRGFYLGLEYMTNNTFTVAGRPIEIIWEDTTNTPDVARERTLSLLERDRVELVTGFASSGDAMASLALFEEFRTVAVIDPAAADAIIAAPNWNEYIFRTGRTSGQDALAMVSVLQNLHPEGGVTVATLAPDSTFGFAMVDPFIAAAEAAGFDVLLTEFIPPDATDASPQLLRLRSAAPQYLYTIWAGPNSPWIQIDELDLQGAGVTLITGAPERDALAAMIPLGQMGGIGFCVYYYTLPQNQHLNDWMVRRHFEEHNMAPDLFTSGGFAAASAIITALEITGGVTDPDVLIPTMRGMEFNTPTGMRYFRYEDHQAMQDLFEIDFTWQEGDEYMVPSFRRVIGRDEIVPPILNGR